MLSFMCHDMMKVRYQSRSLRSTLAFACTLINFLVREANGLLLSVSGSGLVNSLASVDVQANVSSGFSSYAINFAPHPVACLDDKSISFGNLTSQILRDLHPAGPNVTFSNCSSLNFQLESLPINSGGALLHLTLDAILVDFPEADGKEVAVVVKSLAQNVQSESRMLLKQPQFESVFSDVVFVSQTQSPPLVIFNGSQLQNLFLWNAAGCPRSSSFSAALPLHPSIEQNTYGVDARHRITLAIVLENVGSAPALDVELQLHPPAHALLDTTTLCVTDGAGENLNALFLPNAILLLDPIGPGERAITTIDALISSSVTFGARETFFASLRAYRAVSSGENHVLKEVPHESGFRSDLVISPGYPGGAAGLGMNTIQFGTLNRTSPLPFVTVVNTSRVETVGFDLLPREVVSVHFLHRVSFEGALPSFAFTFDTDSALLRPVGGSVVSIGSAVQHNLLNLSNCLYLNDPLSPFVFRFGNVTHIPHSSPSNSEILVEIQLEVAYIRSARKRQLAVTPRVWASGLLVVQAPPLLLQRVFPNIARSSTTNFLQTPFMGGNMLSYSIVLQAAHSSVYNISQSTLLPPVLSLIPTSAVVSCSPPSLLESANLPPANTVGEVRLEIPQLLPSEQCSLTLTSKLNGTHPAVVSLGSHTIKSVVFWDSSFGVLATPEYTFIDNQGFCTCSHPTVLLSHVTSTSPNGLLSQGLRVGDSVNITADVWFPEYSSKSARLVVQPSCSGCLELISYSLRVGASLRLDSPDMTADGLNGLTIDFGNDILNLPDQQDTEGDRVSVILSYQLLDVPENAPGSHLNVTATVDGEGGGNGHLAHFSDVQDIVGFVSQVAFSPSLWSPATAPDAGDLLIFQIRLIVANAAAYNVHISQSLDPRLTLAPASIQSKIGDSNDFEDIPCDIDGNSFAFVVAYIPFGATLTVQFRAALDESSFIWPGDMISSSYSGNASTSPSNEARTVFFGASLDLNIDQPVLETPVGLSSQSQLYSTNVGIGHNVSYTVRVRLPEVTMPVLVRCYLSDEVEMLQPFSLVHAGSNLDLVPVTSEVMVSRDKSSLDYCYDPASFVTLGSQPLFWNTTSPASLLGRCQGDCNYDSDCDEGLKCYQRSYYYDVPGCSTPPVTSLRTVFSSDFGNVTNSFDNVANSKDEILLSYILRVKNVPNNYKNRAFTHTITLEWRSSHSSSIRDYKKQTSSMKILEPSLEGTFDTASSASPLLYMLDGCHDAFDIVPYTFRLKHSSGSGAAYRVSVSIPAPPSDAGTTTGNIQVSGFDAAAVVSQTPRGDIAVDVPVLATGEHILIEFNRTIGIHLLPNSSLTTASYTWASVPTKEVERTYDGACSQSFDFCRPTSQILLFVESSIPTTPNTSLSVGESARFYTLVTLPEGVTPFFSFNITLTSPDSPQAEASYSTNEPAWLLLGCEIVDYGSLVNTTYLKVFRDLNGDGQPDQVQISLGNVTNTLQDGKGTLRLLFNVVVLDENEWVNGSQAFATVLLQDSVGSSGWASKVIHLFEPKLVGSTTTDVQTGDAHDLISYTAIVRHANASLHPAFNVTLTSILDNSLEFVSGSVMVSDSLNTSQILVLSGNGMNDTNASVYIPWLYIGQEMQISWQARLGDFLVAGSVATVESTVSWDSSPHQLSITSGRKDKQDFNSTIVALVPWIFSPMQLLSSSIHQTPGESVSIGEFFRLMFVVAFPEGKTPTNLMFTFPESPQIPAFIITAASFSLGGSLAVHDESSGVIIAGPTIAQSISNPPTLANASESNVTSADANLTYAGSNSTSSNMTTTTANTSSNNSANITSNNSVDVSSLEQTSLHIWHDLYLDVKNTDKGYVVYPKFSSTASNLSSGIIDPAFVFNTEYGLPVRDADLMHITLDCVAADVAHISGNSNLSIAAELSLADYEIKTSASLLLHEPELVGSTTTDVQTGDAHDLISYTTIVRHANASLHPAFNVTLTSILDNSLEFVSGSVMVSDSLNTSQILVLSGNGMNDTNASVYIPWLYIGQEMQISWQARLGDFLVAGSVATVESTVSWDSSPHQLSITSGRIDRFEWSTYCSTLRPNMTLGTPQPPDQFVLGEVLPILVDLSIPEGIVDSTNLTVSWNSTPGMHVHLISSKVTAKPPWLSVEGGQQIGTQFSSESSSNAITFELGKLYNNPVSKLRMKDSPAQAILQITTMLFVPPSELNTKLNSQTAGGITLAVEAKADFGLSEESTLLSLSMRSKTFGLASDMDCDSVIAPGQLAECKIGVSLSQSITSPASDLHLVVVLPFPLKRLLSDGTWATHGEANFTAQHEGQLGLEDEKWINSIWFSLSNATFQTETTFVLRGFLTFSVEGTVEEAFVSFPILARLPVVEVPLAFSITLPPAQNDAAGRAAALDALIPHLAPHLGLQPLAMTGSVDSQSRASLVVRSHLTAEAILLVLQNFLLANSLGANQPASFVWLPAFNLFEPIEVGGQERWLCRNNAWVSRGRCPIACHRTAFGQYECSCIDLRVYGQRCSVEERTRVLKVEPSLGIASFGGRLSITGYRLAEVLDIAVADVTGLDGGDGEAAAAAATEALRASLVNALARLGNEKGQDPMAEQTLVLEAPAMVGTGFVWFRLTGPPSFVGTESLVPAGPQVSAIAGFEETNAVFGAYYTGTCPEGEVEEQDGSCHACYEGAYCPGGPRMYPLPGYWSQNELNKPIQCPHPPACPGITRGQVFSTPVGAKARKTDRCARGYTSYLCGRCQDGFFSYGSGCYDCGDAQDGFFTITVLTAIFLFATIIVALAWAPSSAVGTVVGIVVSLQHIALLGRVIGTFVGNAVVEDAIRFCAIFNFDLAFVQPGCSFPALSSKQELFGTFGLCAIVLFASILASATYAWCCYKRKVDKLLLQSGRQPVKNGVKQVPIFAFTPTARSAGSIVEDGIGIQTTRNLMPFTPKEIFVQRSTHAALMILNIVHLRMCELVLKGLHCEDQPDPYNKDGKSRLSSRLLQDPGIVCYSEDHISTAAAAYFLLIFVVIGTPAGGFFFLRRHVATLRPTCIFRHPKWWPTRPDAFEVKVPSGSVTPTFLSQTSATSVVPLERKLSPRERRLSHQQRYSDRLEEETSSCKERRTKFKTDFKALLRHNRLPTTRLERLATASTEKFLFLIKNVRPKFYYFDLLSNCALNIGFTLQSSLAPEMQEQLFFLGVTVFLQSLSIIALKTRQSVRANVFSGLMSFLKGILVLALFSALGFRHAIGGINSDSFMSEMEAQRERQKIRIFSYVLGALLGLNLLVIFQQLWKLGRPALPVSNTAVEEEGTNDGSDIFVEDIDNVSDLTDTLDNVVKYAAYDSIAEYRKKNKDPLQEKLWLRGWIKHPRGGSDVFIHKDSGNSVHLNVRELPDGQLKISVRTGGGHEDESAFLKRMGRRKLKGGRTNGHKH